MGMVRYPLPITNAMLAVANPNFDKPRYTAAGAADWHGAQFGNEVDQAEANQAIANSHSAAVSNDYDPHHQKAKAKSMVPPLVILTDLGDDFGFYSGAMGRAGTIKPLDPYPTGGAPNLTTLAPSTAVHGAANATVTITANGGPFNASSVPYLNNQPIASFTVVNATTITATFPHSSQQVAGPANVAVLTNGGLGNNLVFTYT